ncbi:MAG: DUF3160 domain-containing protein, partial [Fibromonadaceae bacterium]|nr:DUF3160 domain-containing protein [Fibromonadaceae bacterium]
DELVKLTSSTLAKHKLFDEGLKAKSDTLQGFMDFLIEVSKKELAKKTLSIEEYGKIYSIGGAIENFTLSVLDPDISSGLEKYCAGQYDADCFGGWQLVTGPDRSIAVAADIYTRNMPDCPKNGILHVATGKANEIYVVVEINGYLYLTRGATFSYYEFVMPPNTRLTDEEWQKMEENKPTRPAIQKWMQGIIVDNNAKPAIHEVEHSIYCCADSED